MPTEDHITLWDLYQAIQSLDKRVTAVEQTLKILVDLKADHEARIRSSERWQYAIPPAVLGSLSAAVLALMK